MNANPIDFSDLDDLDAAPVRAESAETKARKAAAPMITCPRCAGRGTVTFGYRSGPCYLCKSSGQVRADWEKKRAAFRKGEQTKAQNARVKSQEWKEAYPAEAAWLRANDGRSEFARSLSDGLEKYGHLTPNQLAAVQRAIVKDAEFKTKREQEATERQVDMGGTGQAKLVAALNQAKTKMQRQPSLIVGDIDFQRAPDTGKNPGAVYVRSRSTDTYLGKLTPAGAFQPSRECTEETKAQVATIMLDPLAAAIEHGKLTGECACCKRKLTDPVSVANGIGPICAQNFGWG